MSKETTDNPRGVLDRRYAGDRKNRPELIFRLGTRARLVSHAVRVYMRDPSGLKVLDMGAAEGRTLIELDRLLPGNDLVGIEYSRELVEAADQLPQNIVLIQGDVTRLPDDIGSGSVDTVTALAVLEHLASPTAAVAEATRVLRPGGLFVASSPSPAWSHASSRLGLLKEDSHECEITSESMVRMVRDAGLNLLESLRFMWAPVSFLPYLRIPISPEFALRTDRIIHRLRIFDCLFVNQAVIARKPFAPS